MMKNLSLLALFLLPFFAFSQTATLRGVVRDDAGRAVPNTTVKILGTTIQSTTDSAGAYVLENVPFGNATIVAGDDKSITGTETINVTSQDMTVNVVARMIGLESINTGITDIPVISLGDDELRETSGGNVSSVLTASRDAFNSAAAYVFSAGRFRIRGYDDENFPTLVNGVYLYDLSNGRNEYFSWSGLNDVVRSRENTVGLQPADYSFGSVGGSNSIDARASRQRKQLSVTYSLSNRTYSNRFMVTYGSGIKPSGWSYSLSYSRRWADEGYLEGTYYDGNSFYGSLEKRLNPEHSVALTGFGASNETGRGTPVVQEMYDLAGTNYYNPNWGYQNGKKRNATVAKNFQPLFILSHDWKINDRSNLETAISYQFGKNKYSGIDWLNAIDPRPQYYRYLPSFDPSYGDNPDQFLQDSTLLANYYSSNPEAMQIQWANLYEANRMHDTALYVISDRVIDGKRYGFNTTYNNIINDNVSLQAGVTLQKQDLEYYKQLDDMLGGNYFLDLNQFADLTNPEDSAFQYNDLNNPNRQLTEGDIYSYNYIAHVERHALWAQTVLKYDHFDFFAAAQVAMVNYYRTGKMRNGTFPDDSYGDSKKENFTSPSIKGGLTYKYDGRNYFYANGGYYTRAPLFENAFISPRTRDFVVDDLKQEKITTVEGGYLLRAPKLKARATGYYTKFDDITDIRSFYHGDFKTFVNYALTNIDKRHMGIELAMDAQLGKGFGATAVVSRGEFIYTSRMNATITQDNRDTLLADNEIIYSENLRVGGTPQSAYTLGLSYRSKHYWYVYLNFNYFDDFYTDFNPSRRTLSALDLIDKGSDQWVQILSQEKRDGQFTLDASFGWSWRMNNKFKSLKGNSYLVFNLSVSNILDNQDITYTAFEQLRFDSDTHDINTFPARYSYAFGRTYFLNIALRFN